MDFRPDLSWEFLSPDEITAKTARALRNHVKHVKAVSPFYQETLARVSDDEITALEDFAQLPFTDKAVLATHPGRFLAVEHAQIVETVITSGTTGLALPFVLTRGDLDRLAFNEAISFHSMGMTVHDRVAVMVSLDRLFMAGMAYYRGATLLGANTLRIGVAPVEAQKKYLEHFKPSVLIGVPSFLRSCALELQARGVDTKQGSVQKIIGIGESIRGADLQLNQVGAEIEELWGASLFSTYATTELGASYCECEARSGGHGHPEIIYTEIVNEKGEVVPDGTVGELVATPLGVEGMPLVRYRTGDITFKVSGTCTCGRNTCRIGPILGRKSHMIKFKGTTLYPLAITSVLDAVNEIKDYIIVLEQGTGEADSVTIQVAAPPAALTAISQKVHAATRVIIPILVSNTTTIQALRGASRKAIRLVDLRKK